MRNALFAYGFGMIGLFTYLNQARARRVWHAIQRRINS